MFICSEYLTDEWEGISLIGGLSSAMLGTRYGHFAALSEGGPMLLRCGMLHSAAQCCTVSHSATAWVQKSGIADEECITLSPTQSSTLSVAPIFSLKLFHSHWLANFEFRAA